MLIPDVKPIPFYCTVALVLLSTMLASGRQPAGEEVELRVFFRGQPVGAEWVRVSRTGEGTTIVASGRLDVPIDLSTRSFEARYDEAFRPVSLEVDAVLRGEAVRLLSRIEAGRATTELAEGDREATGIDALGDDTVLLPNNFFAAYEALAVRLGAADRGAEIPVFIAPGSIVTAVLEEVDTERIATPARTVVARRHRIVFRNPSGPLVAYVWSDVDRDHRLVRVSLPALEVEVAREDILSATRHADPIEREGDEQVRIPAAGFTLAATLSKPPGPIAGRLAGAVLVAGVTPADRDEDVEGVPVFAQLAGTLADAGFLVARYDKRGVGQSGGRPESAGLEDYAGDARSVVQYLASRPEVDPDRIVVVGYREGGWIALLTAAAERRVAAVVLAAAPGTTGAALVLEQQQRALARSSLTADERAARVELQQRIHDAATGQASWEGVPEELRRQADTPYFRSLLTFDPGQALSRARQPVLILQPEQGELPAHHADRLLELAASRRRGDGAEARSLPGINDLLVSAATSGVDAGAGASPVSPEIARHVADWLTRTLNWRFPEG